MKKLVVALMMISFTNLHAQDSTDEIRVIKQGKLTLNNNSQISFSNLRYEDDKVYYTNLANQQEEHLFIESILSIDEGTEEWVAAGELPNESGFALSNGLYMNMDDLKFNRPQNGVFKIVQPNPSRSVYNLVDEKGKKNKKALAFVQDGVLYVRPGGIKKYQENKRGLSYTGNSKDFYKTDFDQNVFKTKAQFGSTGLLIVGSVAGGFIGGMILYMATMTQKDILLDMEKGSIFLQKPNR